jgi:hypothetical protein
MITRPLPFEIPYTINTDSNGDGSLVYQMGNDYWYHILITGEGFGGIKWTVKRNGIFLRPALGPAVVMNAGVCSPGSSIEISVAGAQSNSVITGMIYGSKSTFPEELTANSIDTNTTFTQLAQSNLISAQIAGRNVVSGGSVVISLVPGTTYVVLIIGVQSGSAQVGLTDGDQSIVYYQETLPSISSIYRIRKIFVDPELSNATALFQNAGPNGVTLTAICHTDSSVPAPSKEAPVDWEVVNVQNASGNICRATVPAISGLAIALKRAVFSLSATAGRVFTASVWDGINGSTQIGAAVIGNPGTTLAPVPPVVLGPYVGTPGKVMTLDINFATIAGETQAIAASGYYDTGGGSWG